MLAETSYTNEEDFQKLRKELNTSVELIDDVVYMSPAPTPNHQRITGRLFSHFSMYLTGSKCEALKGINLRLYDKGKRKIGDVIPDLSIFCNKIHGDNAFIEDIPVIIAEVVSPTSVYLDNVEKSHLYKRVGVQEYWIIDMKRKTMTVWDFRNNEQYIYHQPDNINSTIFTDLSINLKEFFNLD